MRARRDEDRRLYAGGIGVLAALGILAISADDLTGQTSGAAYARYLFGAAGLMALAALLYWCIRHRIDKGFRYALMHDRIESKLFSQLLNAEIYDSTAEHVATLPRVRVLLDRGLDSGTIIIKSSIRTSDRLKDLCIDPVLPEDCRVEMAYPDDQRHSYYFEFITVSSVWLIYNLLSLK